MCLRRRRCKKTGRGAPSGAPPTQYDFVKRRNFGERRPDGLLEKWKASLERNRNTILYVAAVLTLMGTVTAWGMRPDMVSLRVPVEGEAVHLISKERAMTANTVLVTVFGVLFWFRPREWIYFVALCLGVFLVYSPLLVNLVV